MPALSSVWSCFPLRTITKFHSFRERKRLASGLAPDVVVEWAAIHVAERWTYALRMHVIPVFNINLLP
jgi:hypothetical protein